MLYAPIESFEGNRMKKYTLTFIATLAAASLFATPQAVVFDFGGVMTGEPDCNAVITFLSESFQFSKADFEKANMEKRQAAKQGISDEEFWLAYAQNHKIELPSNWTESFKAAMKNAINYNPNMYTLVEQLRSKNLPVALLSNIDTRLCTYIREFGLYEPFNPCLLSCEIGVEKPDSEAFRLLLKELNLPAEEVIFIDDKPENVEAAKRLNIDAILFESEDQLKRELVKKLLF